MSSASIATEGSPATATWRPMGFGRRMPKDIADPLCEPLWSGRRALVDVGASGISIRDETGSVLAGFDALREAIRASTYAGEAMLDGYLLPGPIRDTVGAEAAPGDDATPTARQMGRQLLFGGGSRRREEREIDEARRVVLAPEAPTAFIVIDMLWLDGEPLLDVPLLERKRLLDSVVVDDALVRRTVVVRPPIEHWFGQWRALGFREFAIKSANSRYRPGTASDHWTTAYIPKR